MKNWLKINRLKIERDLLTSKKRHLFSPLYYNQYKVPLELIQKYAKGDLIDLGCGDMPFKQYISGQVGLYDGLDLQPRSEEIKYVGDIQDMHMIPEAKYDSALCLEVLEHLPYPERALKEINRILKPGGYLILSVPHLSRLHDEPNDYYRFTRYGLKTILSRNNFNIITIEIRGGLFSFIGHQFSTLMLSLFWNIPLVKDIVFWLNSILITRLSYWVDQRLDRSGVFAAGYSAVAQKSKGQTD